MKRKQGHWFRKTTLLVFLLIGFGLQANVMSQKVSLDLKNSTVKEALSLLEKQIDYTFLYDADQINLNQSVNIKAINTELSVVLAKLFIDKNMTFEIVNKHIVITPSSHEIEKIALPQQARTIQGKVTEVATKEPLIGVNIKIKGTGSGTITDIDGNYSISANTGDVLIFTYVGFSPKEVTVGNSNTLNVIMDTDTEMLSEVVVTAMGVKSEKKKLNFAVSTLRTDELVAGESQNFVSNLQGKMAGVNVTNAGGSPNSGFQILIRGISSINPSQNNQPLFVVDGMAIKGSGSNMIDINPNDIADVTVLKGAAASALYGQEAANGVVMITTKSGQSGKFTSTINASVEVANAVRTPPIQQIYGPGTRGVLNKFPGGGWGPLIQQGETIYDNVNGFLETGLLQRYSASASGGNDKYTAYSSISFSDNQGIVPKDYSKKYSILLKGDIKISDYVKANLQVNTIISKSRGFGNSMSSIYSWPINDDITNYRNQDGSIRWRFDPREMNNSEKLDNSLSPLWGRYMDNGKFNSTRNILMASLTWTPVKKLDLTAKLSYDGSSNSSESYTVPRYSRTDFEYQDENDDPFGDSLWILGQYYLSQGRSELLTAQGLATYDINLTEDLNFGFLAGTEFKMDNGLSGFLSGDEFRIPGDFYSYMNIVHSELGKDRGVGHSKKHTAGFFGEIRADYKGRVQLSMTSRVDYSSTLTQQNYFYPSVTGGIIFSELFNIQNNIFSYGKLRGNWARVGKDTNPYKLSPGFTLKSTFPDPGYAINPTLAYAIELFPEMTDSWEIGADLRFFDNNTRLDIAYYSTTVENQIATVRVSPAAGNILQVRNEGNIRNHGVEISVDQDIIKNRTFNWTSKFNFSFNRGTVIGLPDEVTELQGGQYGDIFATSYLNGSTMALSGIDYQRDEKGNIIINKEGYPERNPAKGNLIGNREPDFLIGFFNNFKYKDLRLNFLFDIRKGGDVANITERSLIATGMSKFHETYRNREFLFEGVVKQPDGSYLPNTKSVILDQQTINTYIYGVSSNFIEDGSYIRLSHVTLSYDMSKFVRGSALKGLSCSLTGRNLLLFTKYTGGDPQINANVYSGGSGAMGIDYFAVPPTRNFTFTVNATF